MVESQKLGFDIRIVRYEDIHNIADSDFDKLNEVASLTNGDAILDLGCGYGAVTVEMVKRNQGKRIHYYLSDSSKVQIKRAQLEIKTLPIELRRHNKFEFVLGHIIGSKFSDNCFDKIVAKMVIHEVSKENQQGSINQIFRILKPGGKLIIWDVSLNSGIQNCIQSIIRKKDELAGYHDLVRNRYLLREDEILVLLKNAGFEDIGKAFELPYKLETKKRLLPEFKNNLEKLILWNNFIRQEVSKLPNNILESINYYDSEDNISISFPKTIFSCVKVKNKLLKY